MEFFIIEGTNNKCHEIKFIGNSIFTSYNTNVALKVDDILLINKYYQNYSHTTNCHLRVIENEYYYTDILYINNDLFNKLIFLLENDKEALYRKVQELETRNKYQIKEMETIKTGEMPPIRETAPQEIQELKTRTKKINHHITPTGLKFQVIETWKKGKENTNDKRNLINFKVKLEKYQPNLLSSY